MTNDQAAKVSEILAFTQAMTDLEWVHHGDCVGADADFHRIAKGLDLKVKGHPPIKDEYRAFCEFDEQNNPKGYYPRNRDIVNASDILIATPKESSEQPKGGTWYTVGYASTVRKPVIIVWPDGTTKERTYE